jgi:hypothetical protein
VSPGGHALVRSIAAQNVTFSWAARELAAITENR